MVKDTRSRPKRILLLTFYLRPDLSAGAFRASALVEALAEESGGSVHIDVMTTVPNRYGSYSVGAPAHEVNGPVTIHRFRVPGHRSGMADQSISFAAYAWQAYRTARRHHYDMVVATSSRLMTAALGARVAARQRAPLYLDIRDLFVDTMGDLLSGKPLRHVLPLFRQLEAQVFRSAARINMVSEGFQTYIHARAPHVPAVFVPNGIDPEFITGSFTKEKPNPKPLIVYAGNIGEGQGLHCILPEAARRLAGRADFLIVGDGGARARLEQALVERRITNVSLRPPVPRDQVVELYREADVLFLHLNRHRAFEKVLPSKVFELAATGKPILAGLSGYARNFVESNIRGALVFEPCDADGFVSAFEALPRGPIARDEFIRQYSRHAVSTRLAKDILAVMQQPHGESVPCGSL